MCCCLSELVTVEDLERVQEVGHSLGMGSVVLNSVHDLTHLSSDGCSGRPAACDGRGSSLGDIPTSGLHKVLPQACDGG